MRDFSSFVPVVEQDPTDPAFVENPYPFYRHLRAQGDVVFWKDYGFPVATTLETVRQVMKHPHLGRAVPKALRPTARPELAAFDKLEQHSLLEIEPPDHTRIRKLAMQAFAGPKIAGIAIPISQLADQLIDALPEGPFDLIEAYAKPLAARSITAFLGVSQDHAARLQTWSNAMVAMYQARRNADVEREAEAAAGEFADFMRGIIAERRKVPQNDFISRLVAFQRSGDLSEEELLSTAILLLNAGHEATAHTLGNAVPLLLDFTGRVEALAPGSIAGTVEECLRFRPPLHLFTRQVYQPVTVAGVPLQPGNTIGCLLASACRDDAVWPDGEKFDPFRIQHRHTAFGVGLHSCLGAALARLELQIGLPVLFARCPDLTIVEPPRVANLYHFHGYEAMQVTVRQAPPQST